MSTFVKPRTQIIYNHNLEKDFGFKIIFFNISKNVCLSVCNIYININV